MTMEQAEKDLNNEIKSLEDQLTALKSEQQYHRFIRASDLLSQIRDRALFHFGKDVIETIVCKSSINWEVIFKITLSANEARNRGQKKDFYADPVIKEIIKNHFYFLFEHVAMKQI